MNHTDGGDYCPKCGSSRTYIRFSIKDHLCGLDFRSSVFKCYNCGFMFQGHPPEDTSILYPKEYAPHIGVPEKPKQYGKLLSFLKEIKDECYSKKIGLVPELIKDGHILEIGCANGNNLESLRNQGWDDINGIELVPDAAQEAMLKGFPVLCGEAEEMLEYYPDNTFDVIIASMVIEHIKNPFELVKLISKKLKPGGQFLFSTAQRDSIDYWIYKGYWVGFDIRHMVFFRKQDIKDMLEPYFNYIEIYHQLGAIDFIRSSTWRVKDGRGNIFDKLIIAIGERKLNLILIPLSLLGMTTRVSIHCKKK